MNCKRYLENYQILKAERLNLIEERSLILLDEALPGAIDYAKDRVQTSPDDPMAAMMDRISKRCEYIDKRIEKIDQRMDLIKNQINHVPDADCKRLLWLKYIEDKTWREVAEEIETSDRHVYRLHEKSINLFKDVIVCQYSCMV